MTLTDHTNKWNAATFVLFVYALFGALLAFAFPISWAGLLLVDEHAAIAAAKSNIFWRGMMLLFPFHFIAFSVLAPVDLKKGKKGVSDVMANVIGFLLFGVFATPYFVFSVLLDKRDLSARLGRLLVSGMHDSFSLFVNGTALTLMCLALAWISYVAIPLSTWKILKLMRAIKE